MIKMKINLNILIFSSSETTDSIELHIRDVHDRKMSVISKIKRILTFRTFEHKLPTYNESNFSERGCIQILLLLLLDFSAAQSCLLHMQVPQESPASLDQHSFKL